MSVAWAIVVIRVVSILLLWRVVISSTGVRRPVVFRLHRRRCYHVIVQIHVFTAKLILKNAGQASLNTHFTNSRNRQSSSEIAIPILCTLFYVNLAMYSYLAIEIRFNIIGVQIYIHSSIRHFAMISAVQCRKKTTFPRSPCRLPELPVAALAATLATKRSSRSDKR